MNNYYTFLALDLARQRQDEATRARRAASFSANRATGPSPVRRGLAHGLAAISRGTALVARQLDECVADDLARSLAPTK
jgi:hypothetical protein